MVTFSIRGLRWTCLMILPPICSVWLSTGAHHTIKSWQQKLYMGTFYSRLCSNNYDNWKKNVETYAIINQALAPTLRQTIVDHAKLHNDVFMRHMKTAISYVSYSDKDVSIDGVTIPARYFATTGRCNVETLKTNPRPKKSHHGIYLHSTVDYWFIFLFITPVSIRLYTVSHLDKVTLESTFVGWATIATLLQDAKFPGAGGIAFKIGGCPLYWFSYFVAILLHKNFPGSAC